ncbi:hypothetical protein JCM15519_04530 [Fundidesulfovibrio butyratiphilus]
MSVNFMKGKILTRTVVFAAALTVFICAASFAQDAPKPQQPVTGKEPAKVEGVMDPDKKLVQDRWGYSTGEPAKKIEKKGRTMKSRPVKENQ